MNVTILGTLGSENIQSVIFSRSNENACIVTLRNVPTTFPQCFP